MEGFKSELEPKLALVGMLQDDFEGAGVDRRVFALFNRRFEDTDEHINWLHENIDIMRALSQDDEHSQELMTMLETGVDLEDDEIYKIQVGIMIDYLRKLGIKSADKIITYLDQVPAMDAQDALEDAGYYVTDKGKIRKFAEGSKDRSGEEMSEIRKALLIDA